MYRDFASAAELKRLTAARRFREIRHQVPDGRWLDVGCSNGVFVEFLRDRGVDARGIDLAETAVREARARGLSVAQSSIEDYRPDQRFEVVTCFDLLEHAIDPIATLRAVHRLLAPGGKVVITVPNQGSVIRKLMGPRWYFYIPEEHLHYFNRSNLPRLLTKTGFETERCTRAWKPLTYRYSLVQLAEYNPTLHRILRLVSRALPRRLLDRPVPLYIGEMMLVARGREEAATLDALESPC